MSCCSPREQKIRDVRTGNDPHDADRSEQHHEGGAPHPERALEKGDDPDGPAFAGLLVLLGKCRRNGCQLAACALDRDAVSQRNA